MFGVISKLLRFVGPDIKRAPLSSAKRKLLAKGRILIVGLGGLGSPAAFYLAAVGIGTLGLVDPERVELSNLHRQIIYFSSDLGQLKVEAAKEKINALNQGVEVNSYSVPLGRDNAQELISGYQLVIDGTDNVEAKFCLNDYCYFARVPLIHAGALGYVGQVMTIIPGQSACLRCLFPDPPPMETMLSCQQTGILGPLVGLMGLIQATEAVKVITGDGQTLQGRLLTCNALRLKWREVAICKNEECPLCGVKPSIMLEEEDCEPV